MVGIDPTPDPMVSKNPTKDRQKIKTSTKDQYQTVRDKSARKSTVQESAKTKLLKSKIEKCDSTSCNLEYLMANISPAKRDLRHGSKVWKESCEKRIAEVMFKIL